MEISTDLKRELLESARAAALRAYCPYSRFRVGAAVLCGGEIVQGHNIENSSFGLSMCAERVAVFNTASGITHTIDAIAISCLDAVSSMVKSSRMPCGACRQVLAEFGRPELLIIVDGVGDFSLADLLPLPFDFRP